MDLIQLELNKMRSIINKIKSIIKKYKHNKRIRRVISKCGCCCHCPNCHDVLNDMSIFQYIDDTFSLGNYKCALCGNVSFWDFSAAPVPLLIEKYKNE